jgi:hypothetical protein
MTNTADGAKKRWETLIEKHGSEAKAREAMRGYGSTAKRTGTGGFYHLKETGQTDKIRESAIKGANARWGKNEKDTTPNKAELVVQDDSQIKTA